jgi:hypothetical protein
MLETGVAGAKAGLTGVAVRLEDASLVPVAVVGGATDADLRGRPWLVNGPLFWRKRVTYPRLSGLGVADGGVMDNTFARGRGKGMLVAVTVEEVGRRLAGKEQEASSDGGSDEVHVG